MAVDEIVNILQSQISDGCSSKSIEKMIFNNLESYFSDKESLQRNIFSSSILSAYEYTLKYSEDLIFFNGLKDILKCYSNAYVKNPTEVAHIMMEEHEQFSEKENMMWTVRHGKISGNADRYDQIMSCFEYIGNVIEISVRGIVYELYAMIRVIHNKDINYEKIRKDDFGVALNNILTKGYFDYIIKTEPLGIKLSDWRNIAKHNSFKVIDDKIECTYGNKNPNYFSISYDELIQYFYQVNRASNIMNISRCIFVYDNLGIFQQFGSINRKPVKFRDDMLFNQIKISLLAHGLILKDIYRDKEIVKLIVRDLQNAGNENCEFLAWRQQPLCNVIKEKWCLLNAEKINIEYFNRDDQIEDILWLEPMNENTKK